MSNFVVTHQLVSQDFESAYNRYGDIYDFYQKIKKNIKDDLSNIMYILNNY